MSEVKLGRSIIMENKTLQAVLSAAIAAFTAYMGGLAVPIIMLMAMMIIDYLSGMAAAWTEGACQARWAPGEY